MNKSQMCIIITSLIIIILLTFSMMAYGFESGGYANPKSSQPKEVLQYDNNVDITTLKQHIVSEISCVENPISVLDYL